MSNCDSFQARDLIRCVADPAIPDVTPGKFYFVEEGPPRRGALPRPYFVSDIGDTVGVYVGAILVYRSFELVSRPDADGWYAWSGGENPVPGRKVEYKLEGGDLDTATASDELYWDWVNQAAAIIAFRLVEDVQPVAESPAASDAKIPISPDAVQEGDRVRVTFDVTIGAPLPIGTTVTMKVLFRWIKSLGATFELLERPEASLAVGDKVTWARMPSTGVGEIKAIDGDEVWVKWPVSQGGRDYSTVIRSELKRADADPDAYAKAV